MNNIWKWFLILIGGIAFFWAALSLFYGITHIGVLLPMLVGLLLLLYGIGEEKIFGGNGRNRKGKYAVRGIIGIGFGIFLVMSVILSLGFPRFSASSSQQQNQTVVVLGCKANENRPSRMLKNRLDAAYELLQENPDFPCVVTGGQGEDELYAESQVMKAYLVEKGIDSERIYEEREASDTKENLLFTKEVIEKKELPEQIVLVTDFYHQYRSNLDARRIGISSQGFPCKTDFPFLFSSWCREMLAVIRDWILS